MAHLKSAFDVLAKGDSALCITTEGYHLNIHLKEAAASSGWWVISKKRKYNRVLLHRTYENNPEQIDIYLGTFDSLDGPRKMEGRTGAKQDRYRVRIKAIEFVGSTDLKWQDFVTPGRNPIRYISKS